MPKLPASTASTIGSPLSDTFSYDSEDIPTKLDLSTTIDDDSDIIDYQPSAGLMARNFTRHDADSILGGELLGSADAHTPSKEVDDFGRKVFSFSLPFGGGLSMPRMGFRLPFSHDKEPEIEALRLRLQRQDSVSTVDEARYFSNTKGTDDVRLRAMKHLISQGFSEILPDFIKKENTYESVFNEVDGPIVVLGGYRGSILRDAKTRKRVWIPLKAGLNLRKINLLLGPSDADELHASDYILPDGVLKNIGPFDICKKFIKKLSNNPRATVKEFGYDWRVSLSLSSDKLIECMEELYNREGKRVIVVAHSMGGLVAHGAMQKRPELFRGIVYVGSPSECLNILGPIRYGDSVMFSDKILTFETNFMMRSSFSFLPLHGRVFSNKETGEFYDLDYFNPDTWVEYNLNPLVSSTRKNNEEAKLTTDDETMVEDSDDSVKQNSHGLKSPIGSISSRIKLIPSGIIPNAIIPNGINLNGINLKPKPSYLTNLQMEKRHKDGRLSPVISSESDIWADFKFSISFDDAYDYLSRTLKQTKEHMLSLEYRDDLKHKYPPMAVVYGDTVPSVRGSNVRSLQDIKDGNYYEFFYGRGDGVVHTKWLMPETKGFQLFDSDTEKGHIVGKFASNSGHVDLMSDLPAMAKALDAILEADKIWTRDV